MARVRKPQPTLENLFFSTPEQKVIRFLLSEPTTTFPPRVISSKLKGVRGLGGAEGIGRIMNDLCTLGIVTFVDNQRAVRVQDENPAVQIMKIFCALCDLEGLRTLLSPLSSKAILFGSRANGKARSDSDYDLFVVTHEPDEVRRITEQHPLGRKIELVAWTPDDYDRLDAKDPKLAQKLACGIVVWGASW